MTESGLGDGEHIQCFGCHGCSPYIVLVDGEPCCPVCASTDIHVTDNRPDAGGSLKTTNWVAKSL